MYNLLGRVSPHGIDGSGFEGLGGPMITKKNYGKWCAGNPGVFLRYHVCLSLHQIAKNFSTVACTVLLILAQTIQTAFSMTYFCVQAL